MLDDKCVFLALRLLIERIFLLNVVELVQEILVAAAGEAERGKREREDLLMMLCELW